MDKPMVTVLMSVYNGEKFLKEAIESILDQTFTGFEFLIINDGSTDNSVKIIESYKDPRIRLINNEKNLKLIASLNKGISLARGKYIARMDCDDVSMPERLEKEVEFLESSPDYGLVGTHYTVIDGEGKEQYNVSYPSSNELIKLFLSLNCPLAHGSIMGRTELFKKNLYGSKESYAVEDYELWTRIAKMTKIHNIPEYLFKYRVYGESFSDSKTQLMYNQTLELSKKQYISNKKEYKELVKRQILSDLYKQEKEETVEYINKWILSFAKRFLYVREFGYALKLYIKHVKINKHN
ncbi:glycosyl transferase family 2 [Clostridium sp. DL-VIII]|uniref:glycosyltransferase family 2 protein n=1 Tax=Clostridium sp. DL-VIII TaxID=641107 RepID=UPI00023B066A|nr:glycosyltransferase family 2 protein [Clostridium sp. DL-VIII]EHJ02070.1 glycosyl transferase family 2 [Clostridium sp. DL-VIII]